MSRRFPLPLALVASLCLPQLASAFDVYTVGSDSACNFASIQDAIDAAKAHPGPDDIFVSQDGIFTNQALRITDDDVNIEGGFPSCDNFDTPTSITGISGTSGHSIFEIEGNSHVALWNLELTGASLNSDQKGGAIYFGGAGSLSLKSDWIHNNTAGYGGAFAVNPSGPTDVSMLQGLIIGPNTALNQGGAIRIEGQTTVTAGWNAGETPIYIGGNSALGQDDTAAGGGLQVVGPASFNGSARIHDNKAAYGGGIAVFAHDNDDAKVNLYTTDAGNPVQLANNQADNTGGGIFLKSSGSGAVAVACIQDFSIKANSAQNGAAIYADVNNGHGAAVELNGPYYCAIPVGWVHCAEGVSCNEIVDNVAEDSNGNATNGATVLIQSGGEFSGLRFAALRNHGGSLIQFLADTGTTPGEAGNDVYLYDCVLADNVAVGSPGNLIDASGGHAQTVLQVKNCTIANNQLDSASVIHAGVDFAIVTDSIVYQPASQTTIDFSGTADHLTTAYVLSNETGSLGGGTGITQGAPTFVDTANEDYHLARTSLGVDSAPAQDGMDLDGLPRTIDLSDITNTFGPLDLGAYEIQTQLPPRACVIADTIFCDDLEVL